MTYAGVTSQQYANALDGLWSDLTGALTRLERIAAEPDELDEDTLDVLPVLQYSLHRAGEAIQGPAAAAGDRRGAPRARRCARGCSRRHWRRRGAARAGGRGGRGRARPRVAGSPLPGAARETSPGQGPAAGRAASGRGAADDSSRGGRARLLATGTVGFLAGAVLVIWPLWAAGPRSRRDVATRLPSLSPAV